MDTITTALAWLSGHPFADVALVALLLSTWVVTLWLRERHEARDALRLRPNDKREVDFASPRLPWPLRRRRMRSDLGFALLLIVAAGLIASEADDAARHWLAAAWILLVAAAAVYDAWRILLSRKRSSSDNAAKHA